MKGLTQLPTVSDGESDSEIETESQLNQPVQTVNKKCKPICFIATAVLLGIVCMVIAIMSFFHDNSFDDMTELELQNAYLTISYLTTVNVTYYNFTNDQRSQFIKAFNIFDANHDGYLNQAEFQSFFELQITSSNMFKQIDADHDGILSYGEVVAYLYVINQIDEVNNDLLTTVGHQVIIDYGFEFENDKTGLLFLEYVAIFMYFEEFDNDLNGYIDYKEYVLVSSENEFISIDNDQNEQISLDEFGNTIYGENNTSWTGKLRYIFGDNYKNVMVSLQQIKITPQFVSNISNNLELDPLQKKMPQTDIILDVDKEYICFKLNYCYYSYFGEDSKDRKHIYYPPISDINHIGIFLNETDKLTEKEKQRIHEAETLCNKNKCCRNDDEYDEYDGLTLSECSSFNYLQCLSAENECVWDCGLPQNQSNNLFYKRIFHGIDRHNAYSMDYEQTTKDKENKTTNLSSIYISDSCGTMYEFKLTEESKQREMDYIKYHLKLKQKGRINGFDSNIGDHRRLNSVKPQEMNNNLRRKMYVLGNDNRSSITTWSYPYYKNVLIIFTTSYGDHTCSGALISKKHVLTAGHCVSDGAGNFYWDFKIFPNFNAGNNWNYFTYSEVYTFDAWHKNKDYNYDIGILTLDTVDSGYGSFGFGYDDTLTESHWFNVQGYPSDKGYIMQQQYMKMDYVWGNTDDIFKTQTGDVVGGNSGGPAWYDQQTQIIYAVVSHETYSSLWIYAFYYNGLTRITQNKFQSICTYFKRFNETADRCD